jgi:helix-turn-helix, Psq domain
MELALQAKRDNPERSAADCAREYGVAKSTLCHRLKGRPSIQEKAIA